MRLSQEMIEQHPTHSRQRGWQKTQQEAGNCIVCGRKRGKNRKYCDPCNENYNARRRELYAERHG